MRMARAVNGSRELYVMLQDGIVDEDKFSVVAVCAHLGIVGVGIVLRLHRKTREARSARMADGEWRERVSECSHPARGALSFLWTAEWDEEFNGRRWGATCWSQSGAARKKRAWIFLGVFGAV